MKFSKSLIAAAAALASIGAQAVPTTTVGTSGTTFLALVSTGTHTGTLGGTVGTVSGGAVITGDYSYADTNAFGTPFGGMYLAAGPTVGTPSVLTLTTPLNYISFLWGSPDAYNSLTVTTTAGSFTYSASNFGLTTVGNQSPTAAGYVGFYTSGTELITSLTFSSSQDAFEAANFSVTAPVPEPETYALMLAGLGVLGFVARRRKPV